MTRSSVGVNDTQRSPRRSNPCSSIVGSGRDGWTLGSVGPGQAVEIVERQHEHAWPVAGELDLGIVEPVEDLGSQGME